MHARKNPSSTTHETLDPKVDSESREGRGARETDEMAAMDAQQGTTWKNMNEQQQLTMVESHCSWGGYAASNPCDLTMHIGVAGFCRVLMHTKYIGAKIEYIIAGFFGNFPDSAFYQALNQKVQEPNAVWLRGNARNRQELVQRAYTPISDDDETQRNFKKLCEWIREDDHGFKLFNVENAQKVRMLLGEVKPSQKELESAARMMFNDIDLEYFETKKTPSLRTETMHKLVEQSNPSLRKSTLRVAIMYCDTKTVGKLLDEVKAKDKTFDINAPLSSVTALCTAASEGRIETVRMLVNKYKADVNMWTYFGTPIYLAAEKGLTETVRVLVKECNADFRTPNNDGVTPVWIAASRGKTTTVRVLVKEFGADINVSDRDGRSTLGTAVQWGHAETVYMLLQECDANVADVDIPDKQGYTPLRTAAMRKDLGKDCEDMVRMLQEMRIPQKFTLEVYERDPNKDVDDDYEKTVTYHNIYISSKLFEEIRKKVPLEKWARLVYFDGEKGYPFLKDPSYKAYFEHYESEFETHVKDKMKTLKTPPLFRLKLEKKSHWRAPLSNGWDPLTKTYWGNKPTHPLYKAWRENMHRAQEEADRRKSAWLEHMKAPKFTLVVYEHDLVNDKYEKTVTYHNIDIISSAARISPDTLFEEIRKKVPFEKWAKLDYIDEAFRLTLRF